MLYQNVSGIANGILMAAFDEKGKDHDETLDKVFTICRQANLKLNRAKYVFICTSIPFFGEIICWQGVSLDPK